MNAVDDSVFSPERRQYKPSSRHRAPSGECTIISIFRLVTNASPSRTGTVGVMIHRHTYLFYMYVCALKLRMQQQQGHCSHIIVLSHHTLTHVVFALQTHVTIILMG